MALDMRVLHGESCALAPWPLGRKCTCCDTNILKKKLRWSAMVLLPIFLGDEDPETLKKL